MAKRHTEMFLTLCFLMSACADSASSRSIGVPDATPNLSAAGDGGEGLMLPGRQLKSDAANDVGINQVMAGGSASGHADVSRVEEGFTIESKYSVHAMSTGPLPSAKGELQVTQLQALFGFTEEFRVHADIDCLVIVGNVAWMSGPVKKVTLNGEPLDMPPPINHVLVGVEDNGEGGHDPPDRASVMFGFFPANACPGDFPLLPTKKGNIQVRPQ